MGSVMVVLNSLQGLLDIPMHDVSLSQGHMY